MTNLIKFWYFLCRYLSSVQGIRRGQRLLSYDVETLNKDAKMKNAIGGFSLGTLIAVALSWSANHSILWAIIHGFLSWFYVIYYFLFR